ncbi:MAG: type II toxin-antitoxin system VapC family toxin [Rickettsiales bacterium]|jgi:PIN domain nuclease of toxin-antitoxin system
MSHSINYLLDTHILLWAVTLDKKLPQQVYDILQNTNINVFYSVISPWELTIKEAKGKINLPQSFFTELPDLGFSCLEINQRHVQMLREIPLGHGDPFDRMLAAQAKTEKMTLITCDKQLSQYPIELLSI